MYVLYTCIFTYTCTFQTNKSVHFFYSQGNLIWTGKTVKLFTKKKELASMNFLCY